MTNDFDRLAALTGATHPGFSRFLAYPEVDSTNEVAKRLIRDDTLTEPSIILADAQTHGRGRFARLWESPPGVGLWLSVVVAPTFPASQWFLLTFAAAVAAAEAIESITPLHVTLKWPNDVMIDRKKCCGILLESVSHKGRGFVVVGLGINVNQQEFPEPLGQSATSLRMVCGRDVSRLDLLREVLKRIGRHHHGMDGAVLAAWKRRVDHWNQPIVVLQGAAEVHGIARDIAEDGALIVEEAGGRQRRFYAGDVTVKGG